MMQTEHNQDGIIAFLVRGRRVPYTQRPTDAVPLAVKKLRAVLGRQNQPAVEAADLYKTSIDARKKPEIFYVCTVRIAARCRYEAAKAAIARDPDISFLEESSFPIPRGQRVMQGRPVVVGFGPAGMFAALLLAENGMPPMIIERGDDVEDRIRAVEKFYQTKQLDPSSNIQFGAGGAGTFSDGKLMTRIADPLCAFVLQKFVTFGANPDILIKAKPHVGTDVLTTVVARMRDYLRTLGCTFLFRTTMEDLWYQTALDGRRHVYALHTSQGELSCGAVLLALGHSARDTQMRLLADGLSIQPKPFSVGVRIEHLQAAINRAAYGDAARATAAMGASGADVLLPPAEYAVSWREKKKDVRGVYSFCMCPGGEVMAAASEVGGVVVNGMSRSKRDGINANAALAVSIHPADYGNTPQGAIAFQRDLEQIAYRTGGGAYAAPCQTVGDFLSGRYGTTPGVVQPSYMQGHVGLCDLHTVLPLFVSQMLETGIRYFDRQLSGFAASDAVLTGVETRTSSPVRILRGESFLADGCDNLYPIGEGAGYAGGITSAAVDGLHAALAVLREYRS